MMGKNEEITQQDSESSRRLQKCHRSEEEIETAKKPKFPESGHTKAKTQTLKGTALGARYLLDKVKQCIIKFLYLHW
ncbi:MAG: hypothetical protein EOP48_13150 [Sphingobacteriales bacterium]|nr:MAG: hypothetical protein EOP48_13150 [Sphingobacteriales bacterium]